jgi:hypothetical protein
MGRFGTVLVAAWIAACVPPPQAPAPVEKPNPVTYVATDVAGVMFVIVHPLFTTVPIATLTEPSGGKVNPDSDYVLICDGRGVDGMRCEVATEAALARYSFNPMTGRATAPIGDLILAPAAAPVPADTTKPPATPATEPTTQPEGGK